MKTVLALVLLVAACSILRTARVGIAEGVVEHPEGDGRMSALTLSLEPFAALGEDEDTSEREGLMRDEIVSLRLRLEHASEDIAANEVEWSAHVCTEHVEPPVRPWWEAEERFLYVIGAVLALWGMWKGRRPLGKLARRAVGRGGSPEA